MYQGEKYFPLNTDKKVINYIKNHPLLNGKFASCKELIIKDIADGNLNLVYSITDRDDPENTILIKQALPHLRVVEEWKLIKERLEFEAKYYQVVDELGVGFIPEFYGYDDAMCVIMMENLNNHIILRKGITEGKIYPDAGKDVGLFLGKMLYQTSDFHMDYFHKVKETIRFSNPHLCDLTHLAIFTGPFTPGKAGALPLEINPLINSQVLSYRDDQELKTSVMAMKYDFMTKAQALLHGDLHSGSLMVNENETRIIDPEFCFFGPMGFDLGLIIGSIFLNYATQFAHISDFGKRREYQSYLMNVVKDIWVTFTQEFETQWSAEADILCTPQFRRNFIREILRDMAGYAGSKMLRRVMRGTNLVDFLAIKDDGKRAEAISLNLEIGKNFILQRNSLENIFDLIDICENSVPIYKA